MSENPTKSVSRRRFLKTVGATTLVAGAGPAVIIPGRAQPKMLKILKPNSSATNWNSWFKETAQTWGEENDTQVMLEEITWGQLDKYLSAQITAQQGHDIIYTGAAPVLFEDQVIDHREIYEACERRYGKPHPSVIKSTYNPKTKKYLSFCKLIFPLLIHYRKDLWDAVGVLPDSWEAIRFGGRKIRLLHDTPVGMALAPYAKGGHADAEATWRAVLYAFGASVQNAEGAPALNSKAALEALKFGKVLYEEAMMEEVLDWGSVSNNRAMLAGDISLTLNFANILRAGENLQLPVADDIWLASTPQGPVGRLAPWHVVTNFFIWTFADNITGAKQFLVDYTAKSRDEFLSNQFTNYPSFPGSVPDMEQLIADHSETALRDKYQVLTSAAQWSTNFGYPGHYTLVADEIDNTRLIPKMFAAAATGKMTPEEALTQADQEVRKVYDKWRGMGKI